MMFPRRTAVGVLLPGPDGELQVLGFGEMDVSFTSRMTVSKEAELNSVPKRDLYSEIMRANCYRRVAKRA